MPSAKPQTPRRRRAILDAFHEVSERIATFDESRLHTPEGRESQTRLRETLFAVRDEYVAGVPYRQFSRCPFTGDVLTHSIDDVDLDGLWWNYEAPSRPPETLPPTYFALTGAVKLNAPPTPAPFLCKPGPEPPYVIPRMLEHPDVLAVVSHVRIGVHDGYAIVYFSQQQPAIKRANTWGTNEYTVLRADGERGWDAASEWEADLDFELAPWIERQKLKWIAPGDASMTLRDTVDGCPYIGVAGRREYVRIRAGEVWGPSDVLAPPVSGTA